MAQTPSTEMLAQTPAPDFTLPDTVTGNSVNLKSFNGKPVFIIFMCNHCPYVVHILDSLVSAASTLDKQGIATIAISANDAISYPSDSPDKMRELALAKNFSFPYLYDESQEVAKAYQAVCTPDIFLFDSDHKLYYHGQFDSSRPRSGTQSTGEDLLAAANDLSQGSHAPTNPSPAVGCSIKWKQG